MRRMNALDWVAWVLLIIGGINWGLVGLFGFNLVEVLFGVNIITRIIYVLVGISAIYLLFAVPAKRAVDRV